MSPRSLGIAVDEELIGQAAGLGALAAVGGAAAEGFGCEALAGVGDAECAVDEHFQRGVRGNGEGGRAEGVAIFFISATDKFAGEDHALDAELLDELNAFGFGEGHLRGAVDVEGGGERVDEFGDAEVLDDDGIDARGGDGFDVFDRGFEFVGEDEGVESEEAFDVVGVEVIHDPGKFFEREVGGAVAGVELIEAEVDGIGAVGDGGAHGIPVAGGREKFGAVRKGIEHRAISNIETRSIASVATCSVRAKT